MMANVSSHLRNFAVAEVIGFVAMLDGHPGVTGKPTVQQARAQFQQAHGTIANPFTHAIPSDMLLNGDSIVSLYRSADARNELERVFGMGVMAPEEWEGQEEFTHEPRQNNIVDSVAERHRYGGGLVEAFRSCGEAAVIKGEWNGTGKRRHDLNSLTMFIADIYESVWIPLARSAYSAARSYFGLQLDLAPSGNHQRREVLEQRIAIIDAQIHTLERETRISPEAARNVWKFTAAEAWT
jgi:hypothetical protein